MLRAAIYGLGRWGSRLVDSVQGKSDKIRFVKGISPDPLREHAFSEKTGVPLTGDYDEALRDPDIDAVVLATPHSLHHEQIVRAAGARKHVFVEKPFTLTRETAEQSVAACRNAGVTLAAGFNRRYAPAFLEMIRRLRAGEIGNLQHLEGQNSGPYGYHVEAGHWRANRAESPAGAMTARGIHTLDLMIHMAGLVQTVFAFSDRRQIPVDIDDTTSMLLRFAGGATGYLGTLGATINFWRLHAFGSRGWIEMRGNFDLVICQARTAPLRLRLPEVDLEKTELEAFADAVARGEPFAVPPAEIINGIAVLEAIVASASGGDVVRVG
jgi:predicted dehydrogenase